MASSSAMAALSRPVATMRRARCASASIGGRPAAARTARHPPARLGGIAPQKYSQNSSVCRAASRDTPATPTEPASTKSGVSAKDTDEEYDVVVIGSGIGGLSAASLLAKYGYSVKLFESHYLPGGCCHMFDHRDKDGGLWSFEVGPSIWEGLDRPTGNPLRMVFDALDETMPVEVRVYFDIFAYGQVD